jgi:SOS response regulatory protein OraA/RecX
LDEEVLALREAKEQEKVDEVINSQKTEEEYVGADFKAIVHQKKRKGDPAVPSLVSKLRERHEETKGRPDLTLLQYLADRGYEGDDVDRVVSEVTNNRVVSEVTNNNMRMVEDGSVPL